MGVVSYFFSSPFIAGLWQRVSVDDNFFNDLLGSFKLKWKSNREFCLQLQDKLGSFQSTRRNIGVDSIRVVFTVISVERIGENNRRFTCAFTKKFLEVEKPVSERFLIFWSADGKDIRWTIIKKD